MCDLSAGGMDGIKGWCMHLVVPPHLLPVANRTWGVEVDVFGGVPQEGRELLGVAHL